jgi:putative SOS response-associated peptidase YedK
MCGRYVSVSSPTILAERFKVEEVRITETEPSYNVAPRADVPVIAESKGVRTLDLVRWGLVPSWAKDLSIGDRMINARAEKITTSNAYKRAFERRRCIIPADGFYEWEKIPVANRKTPIKQPWFFRRRDGEPLAFAGLWEVWHDPNLGDDAPRVRSCVIITTDANDVVRPVHDRMPVVLAEREWSAWLDRDNHDVAKLQKLLVPAPAPEFEAWPVSMLVNKADNNSPELLDPVPVAPTSAGGS